MERRVPMLAVALLVAVVASAAAQTGNRQQPVIRAVDGASIFRNYCAACHGLDGRGNGPVSKALKREIPDLTRLSQRNDGAFPAIHVRNTIMFGADDLLPAHGSKEMPIWGPLLSSVSSNNSEVQLRISNLTKYIESLQVK